MSPVERAGSGGPSPIPRPSPCRVCHEPAVVVCVGCGAIQQPPATIDPFVVMGLPHAWHIDLARLEQNYRQLVRKIHPDRQAGKSHSERLLALQWTATVNSCRKSLQDPDMRAWYLATGSAHPPERGLRLDPAFLAEMFEWREEDEDRPGSFAEKAVGRAAEIRAEIEQLFTEWEAGRGDLCRVQDALSRLKYVS